MLFGIFSPIILAFLINEFNKKLYKEFYFIKDFSSMFILAFLYSRLYFFTRAGFF